MAKISVQIYTAKNGEYAFRVKGGNARITLTPGETYKTRGSVRRALRTLASWTVVPPVKTPDDPLAQYPQGSPLTLACFAELDREQAAWNKRKRGPAQ